MKTGQKPYGAIFKSIFISYVAACIIILLVTGIGYFNYYHLFKENILSFAQQQADTVTAQVELGFIQIRKALDVMSGNHTLSELMELEDRELSKRAVEIRTLQSELSAGFQNQIGSGIYAYFCDSQSVLGAQTRRYNQSMMGDFAGNYKMDKEEMLKLLDYKGAFGSYVFDDGRVWMMQTIYNRSHERKAVLIIESRIEAYIDYMDDAFKDNVLVFKAGDTVLYSSVSLTSDDNDSLVHTDAQAIKINGDGYYFVSSQIPSMGWQCFMGIPEVKLFHELRIFWVLLGGELIGAVFLMFFMSWKFANRAYRPVSQLVELINQGQDERFKETYDSLGEKLRALMEENSSMLKKARLTQELLDAQKASRIFNGEITDMAIIDDFIQNFMGNDGSTQWVLALIHIPEDADKLFRYDQYYALNEGDIDLKFFVLKNVLEELLGERAGRILSQDGDYVLCVSVDDEAQRQEIHDRLQNLMEFYQGTLKINIYVMLGQCEADVGRIPEVYKELQESLKYQIFWVDDASRGRVWRLEEVLDDPLSVSFSEYMDSSRKFFNCLDAGDYEQAYKTLVYIFEKTFPRNKKYFQYNLYRMYGLISALTMTLNIGTNEADREFIEGLRYEERLFNAKNVEQLMHVSRELFGAIIDYNANKESDGHPVWLSGVLKYIQDNFTDMNISVAEIADQFNISVPHLSRTFKQYRGNGVLEYIHKLRVEQAKQCIAQGLTIKKAAETVGYLDSKALARAFKRYEGITPGQYKELVNAQPEMGTKTNL